jgi:hypothetical protein
MFKKLYKRMFIKNALELFVCSASYRIISFFAELFFSKARRRTKMLALTDRLLNRKICRCQKLHYRCEYFKNKLEQYNKKYLPV